MLNTGLQAFVCNKGEDKGQAQESAPRSAVVLGLLRSGSPDDLKHIELHGSV